MASTLRYRIGTHAALELLMGDITNESTDAIVNAANSGLLGGGGVDGAIHDAAGPALLAECKKIREQRGPLPAGQAVTTSGANLKARYVIHTVGPVWQGGGRNEPQVLESCYCHSLEEANRHDCSSVSFPSISTGAFGYPVDAAAQIAVRTVVDLLQSGPPDRAGFARAGAESGSPDRAGFARAGAESGPPDRAGFARAGAETPESVKLVRFVLFNERAYQAYARAVEELVRSFPHLQIAPEPQP